jgi:hypothetical protein
MKCGTIQTSFLKLFEISIVSCCCKIPFSVDSGEEKKKKLPVYMAYSGAYVFAPSHIEPRGVTTEGTRIPPGRLLQDVMQEEIVAQALYGKKQSLNYSFSLPPAQLLTGM